MNEITDLELYALIRMSLKLIDNLDIILPPGENVISAFIFYEMCEIIRGFLLHKGGQDYFDKLENTIRLELVERVETTYNNMHSEVPNETPH